MFWAVNDKAANCVYIALNFGQKYPAAAQHGALFSRFLLFYPPFESTLDPRAFPVSRTRVGRNGLCPGPLGPRSVRLKLLFVHRSRRGSDLFAVLK